VEISAQNSLRKANKREFRKKTSPTQEPDVAKGGARRAEETGAPWLKATNITEASIS